MEPAHPAPESPMVTQSGTGAHVSPWGTLSRHPGTQVTTYKAWMPARPRGREGGVSPWTTWVLRQEPPGLGGGKGFFLGLVRRRWGRRWVKVSGPYEEEEEGPPLKALSCLSVESIRVCLAQLR